MAESQSLERKPSCPHPSIGSKPKKSEEKMDKNRQKILNISWIHLIEKPQTHTHEWWNGERVLNAPLYSKHIKISIYYTRGNVSWRLAKHERRRKRRSEACACNPSTHTKLLPLFQNFFPERSVEKKDEDCCCQKLCWRRRKKSYKKTI